jgi:hypothetical protein
LEQPAREPDVDRLNVSKLLQSIPAKKKEAATKLIDRMQEKQISMGKFGELVIEGNTIYTTKTGLAAEISKTAEPNLVSQVPIERA